MTRPEDEYPPLDVTSTLHMGSLDEVLEGTDSDVVPSRMAGSLPPGMALLVVRRGPNAGARFLLDHDVTTSYLGSSTGLRLRHVQPTGHYGCTGKDVDLTRSAWVGGSTRDFAESSRTMNASEQSDRAAHHAWS